ncbi:hypothetical protein [Brevundimonas sp.]|uniref:hypothetical protein n=1 Tax=Brevundimonas sp. TaxID=1871086 RepID=UPI002FDB6AAE
MVINIDDLREEKLPPKYTVASEHLGDLGFRAVYGIDYPALMTGTNTASDDEFIGKLMVRMGWRMSGPEKLTDAQRSNLTKADMENFCHAFVAHEPTIFEGNPPRRGEDRLTYVRRAGGEAVKNRRGPFEKSALLDALSLNENASSRMRELLEITRPPSIDLPLISRNPINDTNFILKQVKDEIRRMAALSEAGAELQSTLNDYARTAISEMKASSDQTERNARQAMGVGVAGVLTGVLGTLIALGTWFWTAEQQTKAEAMRSADAATTAIERQADRELLRRQLAAIERLQP